MVANIQRSALRLVLLVGGLGCAAPVEGVDEPVESHAEALNFQPDFRVGVIAIKGSSSSNAVWAADLASGPTRSGVTWFSNGSLNADGPRIGLLNYAPGTLPTMATDFRLTLTVWDVNNASSLNGRSFTATTQWASEGPNTQLATPARLPVTLIPDRFQVGIETRPWPPDVQQTLVDFRIAANVCQISSSDPLCGTADFGLRVTSFMSEIPRNTASWTPTIPIPRVFHGDTSRGTNNLNLWLQTILR